MGKPKGGTKEERTDFSWAERYLEDRRIPKYERIRTKFPRSYSRTEEGNIDWYSEDYKRSFRGHLPGDTVDYENLSIRKPLTSMDAKYRFVNDAKNGSNVPEGFYGTESGIFPIDFIPFTVGEPTDHPRIVSSGESMNLPNSGVEFLIGLNTDVDNMKGITPYYPSYSGEVGRFEWEILPEFQSPTYPDVRFPLGARKKRTFRW